MTELSFTDNVPATNALLERLERRIAELEADIRLLRHTIEHLERSAPKEDQ
jgi:hypothetical protein